MHMLRGLHVGGLGAHQQEGVASQILAQQGCDILAVAVGIGIQGHVLLVQSSAHLLLELLQSTLLVFFIFKLKQRVRKVEIIL